MVPAGLGNFAKEAAIESGIGLLFDVTKTEAMSGIHQKYDPQGVLKEAQDDFKESAHEESEKWVGGTGKNAINSVPIQALEAHIQFHAA